MRPKNADFGSMNSSRRLRFTRISQKYFFINSVLLPRAVICRDLVFRDVEWAKKTKKSQEFKHIFFFFRKPKRQVKSNWDWIWSGISQCCWSLLMIMIFLPFFLNFFHSSPLASLLGFPIFALFYLFWCTIKLFFVSLCSLFFCCYVAVRSRFCCSTLNISKCCN